MNPQRTTNNVKFAQMGMCLCILFFLTVLAFGGMTFAFLPTEDGMICHLQPWLICIGMIGTLSPIMLKVYRIQGECLSRLLPRFKRLPVAPNGSRWLPMAPAHTNTRCCWLPMAPNGSQWLPPRELTPQPLPQGARHQGRGTRRRWQQWRRPARPSAAGEERQGAGPSEGEWLAAPWGWMQ